ncbi:MAG: aspartate dehydrogenase domain-containing protein [Candidatus Omnitrophota bacterium]
MYRKLKIGIVGCGAIGSSLAKTIASDFKKQALLSGFLDADSNKMRGLSYSIGKSNKLAVSNLKALIKRSDLIVEATRRKDSFKIAWECLKQGRDVMLMSVGGVLDNFQELNRLAKRRRARIYIPSGAISGIDALKAAVLGQIKSVTLTTYKNPLSFKGVAYLESRKIELEKIRGEKVLFSGSAKEAVKYFPQNINVAAVLSLAGIGCEKTKIKIIASSLVRRNIHEVRIIAKAGSIYTRTENILHPDNPKTSYLAVLSAAACLKQILSNTKIGT